MSPRFKPGDPRTIACASKGGRAGGYRFAANDPKTQAAARKGRAASPLGKHPLPLNRNAKRTLRLALITKIARQAP